MRITSIIIQNHRFTTIVFLLLVIVGVNSFLTMPRTENPEITVPAASVFAIYPGASPSDLEKLIAYPLEDAVKEIEDIKRVSTTIRDGIVIMHVEFFFGSDPDEKYDKIVQQVNSSRSELPDNLYSLETMKWRVSDVVLMQLAFTGDSIPYHTLQLKAEQLEEKLKKVNEVRKVEIIAYPEQEVRVSLDMEKMARLDISVADVANAIKSNNANIPGGNINIGNISFGVKTSGSYENLNELSHTIVDTHEGRIVYLRDIASIEMNYADENYRASYNGEKALFLTIYQKEGKNVFDATENVKEVIEEFKPGLGDNIKLFEVFAQSNEVHNKISGFQSNLFQGIALVGLLIFLSLGVKSSLLVIIVIPLSLVMGLFGVDVSNYALQQMTIAGLVIALGLLVDNSIVMTEAINRYLHLGNKPKDSAIKAANEIGWPIVSATLTTVLAFVPIIAMPDKAGVFIRSMPVTIIFTLMFSLLIALTLTPLLASRFFRGYKSVAEAKEARNKVKGVKKLLQYLVEHSYRATIVYALKHKWLVLLGTLFVFILSLGIAVLYLEISFFPKAEKGQFMVRTILPEGTNLDKTSETVRYVEMVLENVPDVDFYAGNVGHGNPRIYYNVLPKNYLKNFGEVFVQLKNYDVDRFSFLVDSLRGVFASYYGARIEIKEFEQSPPVDAPVMVYLLGDEMEKLKQYSEKFEHILSTQPGAINIDNTLSSSRTDLYIDINRDKANILGIPIHVIDQTIRASVAGLEIDNYRDKMGEEYGIVIRHSKGAEIRPEDLREVYVESLSGKNIPLFQVADIQFKNAPSEIRRYNYERTALITADLQKGTSLDDVLNPVLDSLEQFNFQEGYSYYIGGEYESRQESFGGMQRAIVIAILLIFAVLVLQFRSYSQPLIIFTAIPLAAIGSIYALMITGNSFSFTAFIGLTSLVGIVINNSIMLVDYTNMLRKQGKSMMEALRISGETRFTPIVLTTLTTAGGLLPLTLQGGDLWAPMGWTIIGGLLVSTFLTLIVVPVLYSVVVKENDRNSILITRKQQRHKDH